MADERVVRLLEQSQWVIEGTVEKAGAATMPEVPASPNTFVVKVDEVLHGPPQFGDHKGRRITLHSDEPKGLKPKSSAIFFTRSWLYGRTLAVVEVGRIPKGEGSNVRDDIEAAAQEAADRRLAERIRKAAFVVVGQVTDLGKGPELRRPIETEHHPEWATAFVKVREVLKGKPEETLRVVFPTSVDEVWIDSPKLEPGRAAILILQQNQKEKGWPVLRVPGLTALDPLDVQPVEELDRVRKLVEGTQ